MKKYLLLILLAPLLGNAQDCAMLHRDRDPYTKEVRITTGQMNIGSHKLSVEANLKDIDLFFVISTAGICFNEDSTVVVNYAGTRSKSTFRNGGTLNCEGFFHIIFRNSHTENSGLRRMMEQRTSGFTFGKGKDAIVINLTEEQRDILQKSLSCLVAEGKTLLPPPPPPPPAEPGS
jgi:hypothetical protein